MASCISPNKAARLAILSFDKAVKDLNEYQVQAYEDLWGDQARYRRTNNPYAIMNEEVLTNYTKNFGRIFFCGLLQDVRITLLPPEKMDRRPGPPIHGQEIVAGKTVDVLGEDRTAIDIRNPREKERCYTSLAEAIECTVLHECIHAYLREACCRGRCRKKKNDCLEKYKTEIGLETREGHGEAFQTLREALERVSSDKLEFQAILCPEDYLKALMAQQQTASQ